MHKKFRAWLSNSPMILENADRDFYRRFARAIAAHTPPLERALAGRLRGEARLEAAIARAPKNADYRVKLARLLVQMDQPGPASAIYDALLKEQPANADFVFERARIDVQRDSTPAAKERIAASTKRCGRSSAM